MDFNLNKLLAKYIATNAEIFKQLFDKTFHCHV